MKLPNIKKFYSSTEYFADLYALNKSSKKTFSHRAFARKVKWPASYLSDIIKGRRKLTIARGLQFAGSIKLSPAETEYLIFLCLSDYDDPNVSEHFKSVLKSRNLPKDRQVSFKNYLSLFDNIRGMYLRELLLWGQGKVPLSRLLSAQIPFPELNEKAVLEETLNFLLNRKLIRQVAPDHYVVVESELFALDDNEFTKDNPQPLANHYIHQLEILSRLYKRYTGYGFSFSGYIDICKERYPEIQNKMFELRDWLISLSQEKKSPQLPENETFQVELHCIPLFDLKNITPFSS